MNIEVDQSFNIKDIMECGQAFRYECLGEGYYDTVAYGKRLRVKQKNRVVTLDCSEEEFHQVWHSYFDMSGDYMMMQKELIDIDKRLAKYIERKPGIRLLRQEKFEMLMTFIISQNKSMPQIKQLVARISEKYGTELKDAKGIFHTFPTPEQLASVTEEDFRALKVGYRATYLLDAVDKVLSGAVNLEKMEGLSTEELRTSLLTIKGVGRKVSDCVLLFGYHRMDVFPLDVWMKRAVSALYFEGEKVSDKKMLAMAEEKFGRLSGIAQQYIFYGTVDGE